MDDETDIWEKTTPNQHFAIEKLSDELERTIDEWMNIFGGNFTTPSHDMANWIVEQITQLYGKVIK